MANPLQPLLLSTDIYRAWQALLPELQQSERVTEGVAGFLLQLNCPSKETTKQWCWICSPDRAADGLGE